MHACMHGCPRSCGSAKKAGTALFMSDCTCTSRFVTLYQVREYMHACMHCSCSGDSPKYSRLCPEAHWSFGSQGMHARRAAEAGRSNMLRPETTLALTVWKQMLRAGVHDLQHPVHCLHHPHHRDRLHHGRADLLPAGCGRPPLVVALLLLRRLHGCVLPDQDALSHLFSLMPASPGSPNAV